MPADRSSSRQQATRQPRTRSNTANEVIESDLADQSANLDNPINPSEIDQNIPSSHGIITSESVDQEDEYGESELHKWRDRLGIMSLESKLDDILKIFGGKHKESAPSPMHHTSSSAQSSRLAPLSIRRHSSLRRSTSPPSPSERPPSPSERSPSPIESNMQKELWKMIPRYDGTGGAQKLLEFTFSIEQYAEETDLSDRLMLKGVASKLTGDAISWWEEHLRNNPIGSPNRITDWRELTQALTQHYSPADHADIIRSQLRDIRQRGTVLQYNAAFRRLTRQIPGLSFGEAKFAYLQGLNPKIRELIRTRDNITDMNQLYLAGIQLDSHYDKRPRHDPEANIAHSSRPKYPKKKNVDKVRSQEPDQPITNGNSDRRKWNKVDPKTSKCFICDKTGHWAKKCPKLAEMKGESQANLAQAPIIIDSGATHHMFNDISSFKDTVQHNSVVTCANSQGLQVEHIGSVELELADHAKTINNVLHVPEIKNNLLSVHALTQMGNEITFRRDGSVVIDDDQGGNYEIGHATSGLYRLTEPKALIAEDQSTDQLTL
jgi:Retrotransposon gag protein/Zinc knuckle